MAIGELTPWRWGGLRRLEENQLFDSCRREIEALHRSPKTKEPQAKVKQIPVKAA